MTVTWPTPSPSPSSGVRGRESGTWTATSTLITGWVRRRSCWATHTRKWWRPWCGRPRRDRTTASPVESVLEWGERACNLMPCADKVRFVGSGAEATSLAMRVARAYAGKDKIVRWQSHYHGWHDYVMPGNLAPFDVPSSTGIPRGTVDSVVVLPPDLNALEHVLSTDNDIAGVITEGSGASYGTVPRQPGFVEGGPRTHPEVRRGDDSGRGNYRVPLEPRRPSGGAEHPARPLHHGQDSHRRTAAGGAVAGRDEVMAVMEQTGDSHHDRFERVYHGGTFNANPYCAATGNAALRIVATGEMQAQADAMAARLRTGPARGR